MAVVASGGAVGITAYPLVSVVRLGLLVRRGGMAVDAGKLRIVGGNLVTVSADRTMVRNREVSVIEGCAQPIGGGVAAIASRRVASSDVVRDRATQSLCAVPVSEVTAVARGVRGGQRIVVADVAQVARRSQVSAGEGPAGTGVIKRPVGPKDGVVARGAHRGGIGERNVIRNCAAQSSRAVVIGDVASREVAVGVRQSVVVAGVALIAIRSCTRRTHLVVACQCPAR